MSRPYPSFFDKDLKYKLDQVLKDASGAICVELVRKLQQTGWGVIETPVRHLPRLHGKSQFFRWPNLWRMVRDVGRLFVALMVLREPVRAVPIEVEPAK